VGRQPRRRDHALQRVVAALTATRPGGGERRAGSLLLAAPAVLVLGAFFLVPFAGLVAVSFTGADAFEAYRRFFASTAAVTVLRNTIVCAAAVTAVCAAIAVPFCLALTVLPARAARLALLCVMLPLWVSILVRTYSWLYVLANEGLLNAALTALGIVDQPLSLLFGWGAVGLGMVHVLLPYMIMPVDNAVRAVDPDLRKAARSLGARRLRVFATVTLPLIARGLGTGCVLVFVMAVGFYVTPLLLGGRTNALLSIYVDVLVNVTLNWPAAAAAAVILAAVVLACLGLAALLRREPRTA
jgi:ABC-type spermidine/putrescine transport system permease subunit I